MTSTAIKLEFDIEEFRSIAKTQNKKPEEIKLLLKPFKEGEYLADLEKAIGYFPNPKKSPGQAKHFEMFVQKGLNIALIEDTEFTTEGDILNPESRTHLTTQIKAIASNAPTFIYSNHPEILAAKQIGAKKPKFELHALDYIGDLGYKVSGFKACNPWEVANLPPITITKYSHFALAELLMTTHGDFQKAMLEKVKTRNITMHRRMFAQTFVEGGKRDFIDFDWKVNIEGYWFKLRLRFIDTYALHGMASYEGLASASGTEIPHKKILDDLKDKNSGRDLSKADMLAIATQYPEEFRLYAVGDLAVYDILVNNSQQMEKVYQGLKLEMKKAPKLTIGGTVKDLFVASLEKYLIGESGDISIEDLIERFIAPSTAASLKINSRDTKALLAKVEGGRCRNNQPISISKKGVLVDIDINGCYGNGQRNQLYPIGNPVIFSYPNNTAKNDYVSLRKWLKTMRWGTDKCDLVPGAWFARVSSNGELKYSQDFFASWFLEGGTGADILAKYVAKEMKSNTENFSVEDTHLDTDNGELKILNNEIHNAVLSHDGLQWILNVASKRQRNELLDNLLVLCSMHYPKSLRIESEKPLKELMDKYQKWDGKNQTFYNLKTCTITRIEREYHGWIGINLGELLIDELLINRGLAKHQFGKKSPLEQMYKLCINTLYGDLVSKFFAISNTCAGNNITARARAMCWYMEKGFNGYQSITDGCCFDINKVIFNGDDTLDGECVNLHRNPNIFKKGKLRLSGLGNSGWVADEKGLYRNGDFIGKGENNHEVNKLAMEHLQSLFPSVDVLNAESSSLDVVKGEIARNPRKGQYSFEVKDIFQSITTHGTANYKLVDFTGKTLYKCRGYESKKQHQAMLGLEETIERYAKKTPIADFLDQLELSPNKINRQNVAVKSGILKIGQYLESQSRYDSIGLKPGDNIPKSLLVNEFSLSQFTFKSHKQYKMWKSEIEKMKEKTGQSLEVFFVNKDGTLNYYEMMEVVDKMIADDVISPVKVLDKSRNRHREGSHPQKENLETIRNHKPVKKEKTSIVGFDEPAKEVFENVKLECDEFDSAFGFDESTALPESPVVFENVQLECEEFDSAFGFDESTVLPESPVVFENVQLECEEFDSAFGF